MDPNSENAFLEGIFFTKLGIYQDYSKTLILAKEKLESNVPFKNRGEALIFMLRHFDETMTILILHFLRFGALKILTGDYFVLRINKIIYSKQTKNGCFGHFSIFPSTFPTAYFPIHFVQGGVQMAFG